MPNIIKPKKKSTQRSKTTKKKLTQSKNTTKKLTLVPAPTSKRTRTKSSPTDYYNCLLNYAQAGFYDSEEGSKLKIHSCCKKCKALAPSLNSQRDKELVTLIKSYKQVGDSLAKLLRPLQ